MRPVRTRSALALTTVAVLTLLSAAAPGGPLEPSAGPVTSTMKPLSEVEPRTAINATNTPGDATNLYIISQPGSYYLTKMEGVASGKNGIRIDASHVTIDLNGYTLFGYAGSNDGINCNGTGNLRVSVTIKNGVIRTFGGVGVRLNSAISATPQGAVLEDLQVNDNLLSGITANDARVRNVTLQNNGAYGISMNAGSGLSTLDGVTATNNGSTGIYVTNATVTRCNAYGNAGTGIFAGDSTVADCTARSNAVGIRANPGNVTGCTLIDNTTGIEIGGLAKGNLISRGVAAVAGTVGINIASAGSRVEGNEVRNCATGITSGVANSLIIGNSFTGVPTLMNVGAGNRVGTLVTGAASGAINGSSGGGLGTSDPLANIAH